MRAKLDCQRALDNAAEKVRVAERCYGSVQRGLGEFDTLLRRFKEVLEDDTRGITRALRRQKVGTDPLTEAAVAQKPELECLNCRGLFENENGLLKHVEDCLEPEPSEARVETFHGGANSENRGYAHESQGQADARHQRWEGAS
jgi:hypothetical protein